MYKTKIESSLDEKYKALILDHPDIVLALQVPVAWSAFEVIRNMASSVLKVDMMLTGR